MDPITVNPSQPTAATTGQPQAFSALGTEDFFNLLISQLTNQDPFKPTGNEELLKQIASIRDIELSSTLTESLQSLLGSERFSSASALIGRHVTALPDADGNVQSGITTGVRLEAGGKPILQLSNGAEVPLDHVDTIESPQQAAESLVGKQVVGLDTRDSENPQMVEGVVASVRTNDANEVVLELDTGQSLRMRDLISARSVEL